MRIVTVKLSAASGGTQVLVDLDIIEDYLRGELKSFVHRVRLRPSDSTIMLYILGSRVAKRARPGFTSVRQLQFLKKGLSATFSVDVQVVFVDSDAQLELEAGYFQMLNRRFENKVSSLFLSFVEDASVNAHIEVSDTADQLKADIANFLEDILRASNFELGVLRWLDSPTLSRPTRAVILRTLKSAQPATLELLCESLCESYPSVPKKWLSHQLDQLRKNGFIFRQSGSETYVLTDNALAAIPAGTLRTSSDVSRALALGRRQW